MNQHPAICHSLSPSVPLSIIRKEMPPKKPTNAPVKPVMISVASMRNPNQAVTVQNIVAAMIAAKICGRNAVVFTT